uniref:Uncharacterized protein n=1 Tax=Megaselia scalaris TaxID=36166 RepID=T1GL89_MEGSC
MSKDVVDEYIRSMSRSANKTVKNGRIIEKIPQWTNTIDKNDTHSVRSVPVKSKRQVMLIPAQSQMG